MADCGGAATALADIRATLSVLQPEQAQLLRKLLQNVLNSPEEAKFRRLNLANAKIGQLLGVPEVRRGLEFLGWCAAPDGSALELPMGADLAPCRAALAEGSAGEGAAWVVTVLQGPLRKRVDLPAAARSGHLALAIERSRDFALMPRGRQRLLSGYPPRPLQDDDRPLSELGVKTVMLEDRWEQLVSDLRGGRANFVQVAEALQCPTLRELALQDSRDFLRERVVDQIKSKLGEVSADELRAARLCLDKLLPAGDEAASRAERAAICGDAVASNWRSRRQEERQRRRENGQSSSLGQEFAELIDEVMAAEEEEERTENEGRFVLSVERSNLFLTATSQVGEAALAEFRKQLEVRFEGEAAEDAGGLRREFFNEFGRACAKASDLWSVTAAGSLVPLLQPAAAQRVPDAARRRALYRSCGRIFGMALCQGAKPPKQPLLLGMPLAMSFLHVLRGDLADSLPDLQRIFNMEQRPDTPDIRGSPSFLERSLQDLGLEGQLTFSYTLPGGVGDDSVVDLEAGGRGITVTDETKERWLRTTLRYELVDSLREAADFFRDGVCEVIGAAHLALLEPVALQEAWSGRGNVTDDDVRLWQERTVVSSAVAEQAKWFFQLLLEGDLREARGQVLKYSTGSDRWPIDTTAFSYAIEPLDGGDAALPCAMTCGNMLQLPRFSSAEKLRDRLLQAMDSGMDLHLK